MYPGHEVSETTRCELSANAALAATASSYPPLTTLTSGRGDCEDYALLKRKRLAEAGLPRRAMLMTVVIDEENAGHAVLMIRTDRGDFVLDNKRNAILPWSQTGYVYVKRESQYRTGWTSLGGAQTPTVASVQR